MKSIFKIWALAFVYIVAGSAIPPAATPILTGTPPRTEPTWTTTNAPAKNAAFVIFRATPQSGAHVSQALFTNRAWVAANSATQPVPSNQTYNQGVDVRLMAFSSGFGGV